MLLDRPYMRSDYPRERTSVLTWLLCAIAGGFVMQLVFGSSLFNSQRVLEDEFALSIHALRQGKIWTLATHAFLTESRYVFHVAGILFLLYFLGRELLPVMGPRRFVGLFLGATTAGGLAWSAVHWRLGGMHVGAMAAVDALLVVFACCYPNRPLDFLLFFVVPVRLRPKHVALFLVGVELICLVAYEIAGAARPFAEFNFAHSAHLGGMMAGWVYFRFIHETAWRKNARSGSADGVEQAEPLPAATAADGKAPRDLRAEVDRILDKINSQGFSSLTAREKGVLAEARDSLSRQ